MAGSAKRKRSSRRSGTSRPDVQVVDITIDDLNRLLDRIEQRKLEETDYDLLHRKNSLYYRSPSGAEAGDVYMTLIHTCELNRINPYQYLVALLRHADDVASQPDAWLPWNYARRQTELSQADVSPEASESSQPPAPATR
ncbi:MAG: hypothetical protein KatS3mg105_5188 [Gemmatales bacterium]|nr:MAG: hypothetical protein KatS3mg105_5188 [Gemmatales bacterium]